MIKRKRKVRHLCVLLAVSAGVTGCATTQGDTYPVLEIEQPTDSQLSCAAIDGDFHAASNLRSEIVDAHGDAISGAIKDSAWSVLTNPSGAISKGVWTAAGLSKTSAEYAEAATAAGARMEQLLRYKREKDCSPTPSRDPSLNDDEILSLLDEARSRLDAGEMTDKEYFEERYLLLNKMRYIRY